MTHLKVASDGSASSTPLLQGEVQSTWRKRPEQGPVQLAVGDPALSGGLDYMIPRGPFQPLQFYDSVKCSLCSFF